MGSCCECLRNYVTLLLRGVPYGCRTCLVISCTLAVIFTTVCFVEVGIIWTSKGDSTNNAKIGVAFVCGVFGFFCFLVDSIIFFHSRGSTVPLNITLPMEGFLTDDQPDTPVEYMRRPAAVTYAPNENPRDPFRSIPYSESQDCIRLHSDDQLSHQRPYVKPSPLVLNTAKEHTHHAVEDLLEELDRRRKMTIGETSGGGPSTSVDESERTSAGNTTPLDKDEGEKQYGPETRTEARGKTSLSSKYGQPKKSKKPGVPGGPEGAREKDLEAGGASHSGARPQEISFTTKTGPFSKSVVKSPSERQGVHLVEVHETQSAPLAVEESAAVQSSSAEDSDSSAAGKPIVSLQSKGGESRILYAKKKSDQSKESVEDETEEKR